MLTVKDLKVKIDNKEILKGLNLEIKPIKKALFIFCFLFLYFSDNKET